MKKSISIALSSLMLIGVLHISVVKHYCMGSVQASKISLSGRPISCGMEDPDNNSPVTGTHLNSHLCDNVINYYAIDNEYIPTFFSGNQLFNPNMDVHNVHLSTPFNSLSLLNSLYTFSSLSPPGSLISSGLELSYICTYRI
jgi:hypothetical protein